MAAGGDRLRIVAHTGDNCLADAVELAAHARQAGVAAIAVAPPSYFKPATVQDLIEFCMPIAAEADPLPFYYYHIPRMTDVRLPIAEFLHEARFRIPNLRGSNSRTTTWSTFRIASRRDGPSKSFSASTNSCWPGWPWGRGAVGATYNFAGPHYLLLMAPSRRATSRPPERPSSRPRRWSRSSVVRLLGRFEGRHVADRRRLRPVRPPLRNFTAAQTAARGQARVVRRLRAAAEIRGMTVCRSAHHCPR